MANYTSQASVESILGRSLTTKEASGLSLLLNAIDEFINNEIGAPFELPDSPVTRYYDGDNSVILEIDPFFVDDSHPLVVKLVDADESPTSTVDASNYEARPRNDKVKTYLHHRGGTKWAQECTDKVTNIAVIGYYGRGEKAPADIEYLAAYLAAHYIGSYKSAELKSESIEGYSRTFATVKESDPVVSQILDKYAKDVWL